MPPLRTEDLDYVQQSQDRVARSLALLRQPIYPWAPGPSVYGGAPHFTHVFGHAGQGMTAMAHLRDDAWELTIRDEGMRVVCTWRPDRALLLDDPGRTVPAMLKLMIAMVQDGVLPLSPP